MDIFIKIIKPLLEYFIAPLAVGLILFTISNKKSKLFFKKNELDNKGKKKFADNDSKVTKINDVILIISYFVMGIAIGSLIFFLINLFTSEKYDLKSDDSVIISKSVEEYREVAIGKTEGKVNALFVREDYAYLACENGFQIFEIKDNNPKFISSLKIEGNLIDIVIDDIYAYVLSDKNRGIFSIINIEDKINPKLMDSYENYYDLEEISMDTSNEIASPGFPRFKKLNINNNNAFIVDYRGLKIFDISNKKDINMISFCNTYYQAISLCVYGNYVFIADELDGVQIINIEDILRPKIIGLYETDSRASDVYVENNIAYIADGTGGLLIIDVSNKLGINYPEMNFDRHIKLDKMYTLKIAKEGNYLYVLGLNDIKIINIDEENMFSNKKLSLVGTYKTDTMDDIFEDIFVKNGIIYKTKLSSGFAIIKD